MKSVCVFCGSSTGSQPIYLQVANATGTLLAQKGIRVIYGGAIAGLMGEVANAALAVGGEVTGVIPHFLADREVAHSGLTELISVDSMHQRKNIMNELSDGFITIPGGIGTLEELFEIYSWEYLKLHNKPMGILNTNGYYNHLLKHLQHTVNEGFLRQEQLDRLLVSDDINKLYAMMVAHANSQANEAALAKERS